MQLKIVKSVVLTLKNCYSDFKSELFPCLYAIFVKILCFETFFLKSMFKIMFDLNKRHKYSYENIIFDTILLFSCYCMTKLLLTIAK